MVPAGKTRSSRLLLSGSPGTLGISTTRPTPLNTPLATTTLLITVRVPDTPEVTMVRLNVSLALVAAAAGTAVTAEMTSAVPAASSRHRKGKHPASDSSPLPPRAPRLFTLRKKEGRDNRRGRLWEYQYMLTLWCEHPDSWHPCKEGTYLIEEPREWLQHVAPYAMLVVRTLHTVLPIAGAVAGMVFDSRVYRDFEKSINLTESIVDNLPKTRNSGGLPQGELPLGGEGITYSEASGLRAFRKTLFELDPFQRFGGLRRVQGASGDFLWVCDWHYREYDPGPPILPAKQVSQDPPDN